MEFGLNLVADDDEWIATVLATIRGQRIVSTEGDPPENPIWEAYRNQRK